MHEFSELVQFAAPVASVGGIAAIVRAVRARGARRLGRTIEGRPEPVMLRDLSRKDPEKEHRDGRIQNG
jgi:hypothetical protein